MALKFRVSSFCNFPYLNIENSMFLYLNTFSIICACLKYEFSFNESLRRFALLIGMEIRRAVYDRSTFNDVCI